METAPVGNLNEMVANHNEMLQEARLIGFRCVGAQHPLEQVAELSCQESLDILKELEIGSRVVAQGVLLEKFRRGGCDLGQFVHWPR
jgi:hypothetical protein